MGLWEYPSHLNSSALRFASCGECHNTECPTSPPSRFPLRDKWPCASVGKSEKLRREKCEKRLGDQLRETLGEENEKCTDWSLGDDLILCRLSALLSPDSEEPSKEPSVVGVSSSDENSGSLALPQRRGPDFMLIPGDAAVILPPHLPRPSRGCLHPNPVQSLLSAVGIEEVEALNPTDGGPTTGQCQFACLASALSRSFGVGHPLRDGFRPDLELRRLALHTIRMNADMYRDFMTVAGGRTRKQSAAGGRSVDLNVYLRKMSSPSCDGDAVTLQALCDALKITVRIVKPVDASSYDERRQRELLCASFAVGCNEEADDDASSGATSSSLASSSSALSLSNNPYSSSMQVRHLLENRHGEGHRPQRLYISHEIIPRQLGCVDSRIRDVQKVVCGRLVWLSHIGHETHYRFLRPAPVPQPKAATARKPSFCPQRLEPVNEEEAAIARLSRIRRHRRLRDSSALLDGYVHLNAVASVPSPHKDAFHEKKKKHTSKTKGAPKQKNGTADAGTVHATKKRKQLGGSLDGSNEKRKKDEVFAESPEQMGVTGKRQKR